MFLNTHVLFFVFVHMCQVLIFSTTYFSRLSKYKKRKVFLFTETTKRLE